MDKARQLVIDETKQKDIEYEQPDSLKIDQPENSHNTEVKFQALAKRKLDEYLNRVANGRRQEIKA